MSARALATSSPLMVSPICPQIPALAITVLSRCLQILRANRQTSNALSGENKNRVGHGRRDARHSWFADTAHFFLARYNVRFHFGHLVHSQHRIVMKVSLLHTAVFETDLAVESRSESENRAALQLRLNSVWIHNRSAVDGGDDAMYSHFAVLHRHFGHVCDAARE